MVFLDCPGDRTIFQNYPVFLLLPDNYAIISLMDRQEIQKYIDTNTYDFSKLQIPSKENGLVDQELLSKAMFSIKGMDDIYSNSLMHGSLLKSILRHVESKSSTTIENIQTSELQLFNSKILKKERPEVYSLVKFLETMETNVSRKLNKHFLCMLQEKIILNPTKHDIRRSNVAVAAVENELIGIQKIEELKFVPPHHLQLDNHLETLFSFIEDTEINILIRAFCAHAIFEIIHPFVDGNGRVGRVLIPSIIRDGEDIRNMIYVSRYLEKNRERYYFLLKKLADTNGSLESWREWIFFCLEGVVESQKELEKTCDAVDKLYEKIKGEVNENSKYKNIDGMINFIFRQVVITPKTFKKGLNLGNSAAQERLKRLVDLKILEYDKQGTYVFQRLLNIIFE